MDMPLEASLRYDIPMQEQSSTKFSTETATDAVLVDYAQAGEVRAFEELVRRHRNEVFALGFHFLRNREEAWDISQEVFVKAYRSLKWFRGDASFKTWLMRITANQCKDHFKKRHIDFVPFDEAIQADTPSASMDAKRKLEASELGVAINRAVADLPAKHRTAFVLREYEGLSYQEMAEVMQCSQGTVMSRLHHARRKLQKTLRKMGVLEDS